MIPYKVDTLFDHQPVVNWVIFAGLILVFALQVVTSEKKVEGKKAIDKIESPLEALEAPTAKEKIAEKEKVERRGVTGPLRRLALDSWGIIRLLGHNWLHANVIQLIANLFFLWPLGNAVCSKLGNKIYAAVYLDLCLLGGVIHMLVGVEPATGASMAVAGIVGLYLVLFPENLISCYFLLPHPVALSISGYWMVVLWFIVDIFGAVLGVWRVCYCAHIAGLGIGFGLGVLMLKKKWLVMEKDERSLAEMLGWVKKEEAEEEKEGEEEEEGRLEAAEFQADRVDIEKHVLEKVASKPKAEKVKDGFIRFSCQCGKRIKVPKEDAGKTGRCPKCSAWLVAPRE